jgi:hypothetical protein
MANPNRADITTLCECGEEMRIVLVAPTLDDKEHMLHTFRCSACNIERSFKIPKLEK